MNMNPADLLLLEKTIKAFHYVVVADPDLIRDLEALIRSAEVY